MGRKEFVPGTRVRLRAPSPLVALAADTGVIDRPDRLHGYYIVRLDEPAEFRRASGEIETLYEIREAADNLTVIEPAEGRRHSLRR